VQLSGQLNHRGFLPANPNFSASSAAHRPTRIACRPVVSSRYSPARAKHWITRRRDISTSAVPQFIRYEPSRTDATQH
jgi:hypothetical protein